MKNLSLIFIFLLSASSNLLADTEKDIKANLKHVTVYPDRAQITHEAAFELQAGNSILKLGGLSPYIDVQRFR